MLSSFKSKIGNVFCPIHLWGFLNGVIVNCVLADEILDRFLILLFIQQKKWFCFFQEILPGCWHAFRGLAGKKIGRYLRLGQFLSMMWLCIQKKVSLCSLERGRKILLLQFHHTQNKYERNGKKLSFMTKIWWYFSIYNR